MSWRKVFHTDEESLKYMFSKEIESDVITLPPDVDELTDEKYFDDDEMTIPSVKDLSGNYGAAATRASNGNKNKKRVDSELPKKCMKKLKMERKANWTKNKSSYTFKEVGNLSSENMESISSILGNMNPFEIFEEFLTPEFYEYLKNETERYANEWKK
ncbi:uncharacterized protein TNCV_1563382 [Trichonephila clavipes]|nr:uncharacterized protein TNCV_1563382 [Trichonephila clavipes]